MDILAILEQAAERDKWPWIFKCCKTGRFYAEPPEGIYFTATKVPPERLEELLESKP